MLSQLIRRNESKNLNEKLFVLSRVLLKELEFATSIERERSNEEDWNTSFVLNRNHLVRTVEEFDTFYALDLSVEYYDIKNATRICLTLNDYQHLYNLLNNFKGDARKAAIHESMDWLIEDYREQYKKRKLNEPFTYSLQLFEIF